MFTFRSRSLQTLLLDASQRSFRCCRSAASGTARRALSTSEVTSTADLLVRLRRLDTSSLCDAAKVELSSSSSASHDDDIKKPTMHVLCSSIQRLNPNHPTTIMAGIVRTVRLTQPNDFLPVLRGLKEGKQNEVLVIDTNHSTRAIAGELFAREAYRKGMMGIVVLDGPMRDVYNIQNAATEVVPCYAPFTTPYSGTIQSVGEMQQPLSHNVTTTTTTTVAERHSDNENDDATSTTTIQIEPNQIIVGDHDGMIVGPKETFHNIVDIAAEIMTLEQEVTRRMSDGDKESSLHDMTNYKEHIEKRLKGEESEFGFRL